MAAGPRRQTAPGPAPQSMDWTRPLRWQRHQLPETVVARSSSLQDRDRRIVIICLATALRDNCPYGSGLSMRWLWRVELYYGGRISGPPAELCRRLPGLLQAERITS